MSIFRDKIFLTIFILGCIIRFLLAQIPGQEFDIKYWYDWSLKLAEVGPANFYGSTERTDYMPGYLYILWLLGSIRNIFSIDQQTYLFILKIPGIIGELLLSVLVYHVLKNYRTIFRNLGAAAILFNPALIFNSAIWGQIDSLLTIFMLMTVIFLSQKKLLLASIFFSLSFMTKPQALSLIFLPALVLTKDFSLINLLKITIPGLITISLVTILFFPNDIFVKLINLISNTANQYSYNSLSAFNFWGLMGFWKDDNQIIFGLSVKNWGILTFAIFWMIILYQYFKKRFSLYTLASLATLGFYFLPTRVHDRYLYPALIFLIIASIQSKNMKLFILTLILSLVHFINLLYVYTKYNSNASKTLYQFLENNTTLLTVISCGLFVVIVFHLLNNDRFKNS